MCWVYLMAVDAGANSPSLAVSQGEPSASDLEMYACTSRTYVMHSVAEVPFFVQTLHQVA